jgi:hypothetical protein
MKVLEDGHLSASNSLCSGMCSTQELPRRMEMVRVGDLHVQQQGVVLFRYFYPFCSLDQFTWRLRSNPIYHFRGLV